MVSENNETKEEEGIDGMKLVQQLIAYCRRRGSARAQVFGNHGTVRAQGSLENTKWAFGAQIGDGVATRMKAGTHLQQLDSTEDTQKPS